MFSPLEQFDVIVLLNINFFGYDFSITNVVLPLFFINLWLISFISIIKNKFKLIPDAWQFVLEALYRFIFSIIDQQIGQKGWVYLPLLFTLFNFILICNLLSLIPFGIAITSYIIFILFLSMTLCISIFLIGLLTHNYKFLKIFVPEAPSILLILLIPIEIFSYFIRIFSLAIRLTANIFAGHTLVFIVSSSVIKVIPMGLVISIPALIGLVVILILEFGVAFLQAYVFTILLAIYLKDSILLTH